MPLTPFASAPKGRGRYKIIAALLLILMLGWCVKVYRSRGTAGPVMFEKFDYKDLTREGDSCAAIPMRVNVNKASQQGLMGLEGVGKTIANRIISYRDSHGLFSSPDGLKAVKGVSEKILNENRDRIAVDDS